ncbi:MAG TPA: hypothetical protein VM840_12960 [Actinomycetota bacterium]|nr:hypothetical protein [Actinomycetota bacterium]
MRRFRIAALGAAAVALTVGLGGTPSASAACRPTKPFPAGDEQLKKVVTPAGTFYFDYRGDDEVWVYLESNDTEGLQRGGGQLVLGSEWTDDCDDKHESGPDTLLF